MKQVFSCSYISKSRCSTCQKPRSWHYICWGCSNQPGFSSGEVCNWNSTTQVGVSGWEDPIAALFQGLSRAVGLRLKTPTQALLKKGKKWVLNREQTLSWLLLFWVSLSPGEYVVLHCSLLSSYFLLLTLITGIWSKSWALWQIHALGQGFWEHPSSQPAYPWTRCRLCIYKKTGKRENSLQSSA